MGNPGKVTIYTFRSANKLLLCGVQHMIIKNGSGTAAVEYGFDEKYTTLAANDKDKFVFNHLCDFTLYLKPAEGTIYVIVTTVKL